MNSLFLQKQILTFSLRKTTFLLLYSAGYIRVGTEIFLCKEQRQIFVYEH